MVSAPRPSMLRILTGWLPSQRILLCPLLFLGFASSSLYAAPTNSAPESISTAEDTDFTFNTANNALISVADPNLDAAQDLRVSLVLDGLGDLQLPAGTDQLVFDGKISILQGSSTEWGKEHSFQGTIANLNAVLDGILFRPMADNAHVDTLTITTTEPSSSISDTDSVTLTVLAVNDAPVLTAPVSGGSVEEGDKVTFSSADDSKLIFVVDDALDEQAIQMQIAVTNGTATLSGLADVSYTAGGNGTADMTFQGTKDALNSAVDGLVFRPAIGFSGNASIDITVDDLGKEGSGGALSSSKQIEIEVTAANSAPVITVPGLQSIAQGDPLTFSSSVGTQIFIDDDASEDNSSIQVVLTVGSGKLKLASTTGLLIESGADDSATMTLLGQLANLQSALTGMIYTPDSDFTGSDTLSIDVDDLGNTGPGGAKSASESVSINVVSTSPPPENNVPLSVSATEDSSITFSSASNTVSVGDPDTSILQVRLQTSAGTLTLAETANLDFTTGDGTADGDMIFTGLVADLNTALDGLVFQPEADATSATITMTTTEQGAGTQSDTDTITATFTAVNDAPVINFPGAPQQVPVNTSYIFSQASGNAITISDDAVEDEAFVQLDLTATNGTVNLQDDSALILIAGANNSANFSYVGDVNDFNTAFDGVTFTPTTDYQGAAQITIRVNDQGAYGSGGEKETTEILDFTVIEAGSPPVNSLPAAPSVDEDASLTFSSANGNAITVSDSDSVELSVDLEVSIGTLTLGSPDGVTFTDGDGISDTIMAFSGTVDNLNTALDGLLYETQADVSAEVTLTLKTTETVSPNLSDTDVLNIRSVNPINDAPVVTVPDAQSVAEEGTLTFSSANSNAFGIIDDASDSGRLHRSSGGAL